MVRFARVVLTTTSPTAREETQRRGNRITCPRFGISTDYTIRDAQERDSVEHEGIHVVRALNTYNGMRARGAAYSSGTYRKHPVATCWKGAFDLEMDSTITCYNMADAFFEFQASPVPEEKAKSKIG